MCCPKFHINQKFYVIHEINNKREIIESHISAIFAKIGSYDYEIYSVPCQTKFFTKEIRISEKELEFEYYHAKRFIFETRDGAESYIKNTMTDFEKKLKDIKLFENTISLFKEKITELSKEVSLEFLNPRIFRNINKNIEEIKKEYAQFQAQKKE